MPELRSSRICYECQSIRPEEEFRPVDEEHLRCPVCGFVGMVAAFPNVEPSASVEDVLS